MDYSRRALVKAGLAAAAFAANGAAPALAQVTSASGVTAAASRANRELQIVNPDLLEQAAHAVLPAGSVAFMGPAGDGWTYRENRRAFDDYAILPRRLQGVSESAIDIHVELFGEKFPTPILTAPMGRQDMIHIEAEVAAARGTGAARALFVTSGASTKPMEVIANATSAAKWFQIYLLRDMAINRWLVQRAKAAGYTAIVLTADALGLGQSDEFVRLGRPFPPAAGPGNHDPSQGGRGNFADRKTDVGFADISFLRQVSGLPVVVKGLLHAADAQQALAAGADGIWVSNHGGRQIDGVAASVSMLRAIVEVAGESRSFSMAVSDAASMYSRPSRSGPKPWPWAGPRCGHRPLAAARE